MIHAATSAIMFYAYILFSHGLGNYKYIKHGFGYTDICIFIFLS